MNKPLNKYIDHTLLAANAKKEDIKRICEEALKYDFASVCINPYWVSYAKQLLNKSDVKITTVIGFPLGANATNTKVFEAKQAITDGVDELDMVMNIGELLSGDTTIVLNDLKAVREVTKNHILKVIIETAYLTKEQIVEATKLVMEAKADFVKTSTGFAKTGATVEDVTLMKKTVGDKIQIKAAGGVRSKEDALAMIAAGADRIGTSGGVKIMEGEAHLEGY